MSILQDAATAAAAAEEDVRPNLVRGCAKVHLANEGRGGMEGERSQVGAFPPCQSLRRDGRDIVAVQRGLVAHLPRRCCREEMQIGSLDHGGKGENVDDHEFIEPSLIQRSFIFQVR